MELREYLQMKKLFLVLSIAILIWGLSGCAQKVDNSEGTQTTSSTETEDTGNNEEMGIGEYQSFSIQNFHRLVTFEERPKRAVSLNGHTTEIMLALGLEDVMVGTAHQNVDILPEFKDTYEKIPILAEKYPSLEVLLGVEPDFVFGRSSAFDGANAIGTVEDLESYGIKSYVSKGTYTLGATMDDVYEDILHLGRIFQVEDRANELVATMQTQIKEIQKQVGEVETPIRVAVMDQGGDQMFTACQSLQTTLIKMAGGHNVFDDIAKTWARVNWEELVERDPEVIVINNYGDVAAEAKIEELLQNPSLQNVTAIKNKHFVVLSLSSVFEGVRNVEALETLASGFYPKKFEK
ncbi:ABC transporter substrate-binding protein [Caldalkalibacillus mannanilyticus]|uniref:ABC transporter substrate-binding protein n=1 Tax=Caldalkalibacillus mannanilyticus TaxID=1418 RepID=UPI00046A95F1|nr:ABC transporter substrate-binding protein [Caldalkalibacillus mannanilyticus]